MKCIFQSGAAYQTSPVRMSVLPSLLTSATAAPSERNLRSIVVFFQVMAAGGVSAAGAGGAASASSDSTGSQRHRCIGGPRGVGEKVGGFGGSDYAGRAGRLQQAGRGQVSGGASA